MKSSPDYFHNRQLLNEALKDDQHKFEVTIDECNIWFDKLNEQLFGNKLPQFTKIHIGRPRGAYALFRYWRPRSDTTLHIHKTFSSKRQFINVLAHEMIHLYQHHHGEPIGHGPSFWVWSDKFTLKGLKLVEAYHE